MEKQVVSRIDLRRLRMPCASHSSIKELSLKEKIRRKRGNLFPFQDQSWVLRWIVILGSVKIVQKTYHQEIAPLFVVDRTVTILVHGLDKLLQICVRQVDACFG